MRSWWATRTSSRCRGGGGAAERAERGDQVVRLPGGLEIFDGFTPFDAAAMIERAQTIDGLSFLTLDDTLSWKRALGRPKDLEHVRVIVAWRRRER